jgi:hypothetical protein
MQPYWVLQHDMGWFLYITEHLRLLSSAVNPELASHYGSKEHAIKGIEIHNLKGYTPKIVRSVVSDE